MFDLHLFENVTKLNLAQKLVPTPKAAFGTKTKTNEKIGIEVELEKVRFKDGNNPPPYWTVTNDGSLKVNGAEFIICCYSNKTKPVIKILKDSLEKSDCSSRTSVHIHLNIDNLTPTQIILFAYYYMLFEIPLIKFSGGRFSNFFCVPLHEWWSGDPNTILKWSKYSAINVLPRLHRDDGRSLATIEFRQMRGNINEDYIQNWVDLIVKIKHYIVETNIPDFFKLLITANKTSSYGPLLKEIFKDKADLLYYPEINKDIEETISRLKIKFMRLGVFDSFYSNTDTPESIPSFVAPAFQKALTIPKETTKKVIKKESIPIETFQLGTITDGTTIHRQTINNLLNTLGPTATEWREDPNIQWNPGEERTLNNILHTPPPAAPHPHQERGIPVGELRFVTDETFLNDAAIQRTIAPNIRPTIRTIPPRRPLI